VGAFFIGQRCDLVVSAAQFEGSDGLQVFGLEIESAAFVFQWDQGGADGDAVEAGAGGEDVGEGNDGCTPMLLSRGR
jgi:hypothetical protein